MSLQVTEGTVNFDAPGADKPCETWYKIVGDLKCGKPALLALHGGPGLIHDYLETLIPLHERHGIPIVFYDQIGNGKSTHLREKAGDSSFWKMELFKAELANLIDKLDLRLTGFDIIGHSWGGMLGSDFATDRPSGLRKLILTDSSADAKEIIRSQTDCCRALPKHLADAIFEGEKSGDFSSPLYKEAKVRYIRTNVCRAEPFPHPDMISTFQAVDSDSTVHDALYGKTLIATGPMTSWTVVDRLHLIEVPTLVINGEHDIGNDACNALFFNHIPRVRWVTLAGIAHMPMIEAKEKYFDLLASFLGLL
ncbi:hypothetical protein ANO11243_030500 [Dothideomycetidae sp. 11243]|nr:hypothetical protein ANO11243_030500 [fungal sp. No.11243]